MLFQLHGLSHGGRAFTIQLSAREIMLHDPCTTNREQAMLRTPAERLDAALDAALSMTFPASDPVAVYVAQEPRSRISRRRAAFVEQREMTGRIGQGECK